MKSTSLHNMKILLTGASGGIGRVIAKNLLVQGADLLLAGNSKTVLEQLQRELQASAPSEGEVHICCANLLQEEGINHLAQAAQQHGINVLINNAGITQFGLFAEQSPSKTREIMHLNATAPMLLTQALIPHLMQQPQAQIINVGSTFGSIGFPGFVSYSASKAALRGFSEALKRELHDTHIAVKHLSPRATKTALNNQAVNQMNAELKVNMDQPQIVADALLHLLGSQKHEMNIGWPEKLFIKINRVFPKLVDQAIAKQWPVIKRHAGGLTQPTTTL